MATYRLLALHLNCISGNEKQQSATNFFCVFLLVEESVISLDVCAESRLVKPNSALNLRGMCVLAELRISSFRHYVFTQILRCSHAVLDCASLKAEVWTCPDRLTSLKQASGIAEPVLP
ncbi:hypothetical protein T10_9170 [Trichinella papuae]|uniref:Uncharacterized protein n=1 Tax=Trichinella papuae TaxID=268474 RepID=A0A0V1MGU8_9BILA|nr:hypothetical protein T10_9170 [Trichinella papuae]